MMATPAPHNLPWTHRSAIYGWAGESLWTQFLRMSGQVDKADAIETARLAAHKAQRVTISICHPTRGRPDQAARVRKAWLDAAAEGERIEHIFAIDHDDELSLPLMLANHSIVTSAGCVAAWNAAASKSIGKVLVQVSDDFEPPMGWDELILKELGDLDESKVLAVSDGNRKDDLLCMSILTRKRYEEQGYMYHPDFFSMYSDNYFSHRAFADGVVIDARDRLTFNHNHPVFGKGEWDETYVRSNSDENYTKGKAIYDKLIAEL
jgi:hypothetical protein